MKLDKNSGVDTKYLRINNGYILSLFQDEVGKLVSLDIAGLTIGEYLIQSVKTLDVEADDGTNAIVELVYNGPAKNPVMAPGSVVEPATRGGPRIVHHRRCPVCEDAGRDVRFPTTEQGVGQLRIHMRDDHKLTYTAIATKVAPFMSEMMRREHGRGK